MALDSTSSVTPQEISSIEQQNHSESDDNDVMGPSVSLQAAAPVLAVFTHTPEIAFPMESVFIDMRGSIGTKFWFYWGDEGLSTPSSPMIPLSHMYIESSRTDYATRFTKVVDAQGIRREVAVIPIKLEVTNATGQVDVMAKELYLATRKMTSVTLTLDTQDVFAPFTVTALCESENAVRFFIDWGNGQSTGPLESKGEAEAQNIYFSPGTYTVTARAISASGEERQTSQALTVRPPAPPAQARLSIQPASGDAPLTVTVSTEGSQGDFMVMDWGDGTPVEEPVPSVHGRQHVYSTPGQFQATLQVWNEGGTPSQTSQVITALDPERLQANLVVLPGSGYSPLSVLADASGSKGQTFLYDWGDGKSSGPTTDKKALHTYTRPGYYPVLVTVSKNGLSLTVNGEVVVYPPVETPGLTPPSSLGPVEIDTKKVYHGVPRGNMPWLYRYALSQGVCFMPDTLQLFCPMQENGRALENGSALFLGRIAHADGQPVSPSELTSASYTIFRLDDSDPAIRETVQGHENGALAIGDILADDVTVDENWPFDAIGYNFRHVLDDSTDSPFPKAGRNYLVAFTLVPTAGPKIQIQYRVRCV